MQAATQKRTANSCLYLIILMEEALIDDEFFVFEAILREICTSPIMDLSYGILVLVKIDKQNP